MELSGKKDLSRAEAKKLAHEAGGSTHAMKKRAKDTLLSIDGINMS